jgi:hypothetical protein
MSDCGLSAISLLEVDEAEVDELSFPQLERMIDVSQMVMA